MDEIDSLIALIRDDGSQVWFAGPQPEESIVELEQAIGTTMPPSYRAFLSRFGGFGVANSFVSGIIDSRALGDGTGWLFGDTQRFRADFDLPKHMLVVQADDDAPYCLDTRERASDGEFPLICYELHSGHVSRMRDSFGDWFVAWLRMRAELCDE